MGVEMPFPLANPDACVDSGLSCPLAKDNNYEYIQTLPVLKSYPKVSEMKIILLYFTVYSNQQLGNIQGDCDGQMGIERCQE